MSFARRIHMDMRALYAKIPQKNNV